MNEKKPGFLHRIEERLPGWPWLLVDWMGVEVTAVLPEGSWLLVPTEVITYTAMFLFLCGVWGIEIHARLFKVYFGIADAMPYISRKAPAQSD